MNANKKSTKAKQKKPIEVFNEFYFVKSTAAKEYNRHQFNRAIKYYKKALVFKNDDLLILLRISNCYRRIGKMNLAWEFHAKAKELYPESFKMFENEVNLLYETEDYIGCLRKCNEGRHLFNDDRVFLVSTEKALANIEYTPISDERFDQNMINEGNYLDGTAVHRLGGKSRKDIELDERNKRCPISDRHIQRQITMARMTKDRNDIQVNKYYHTICKSLECNDFTNARKNTELLTDLMERTHYRQMLTVLEKIYKMFGAHQLLIFQDIEEWDEQMNHDRAMYFLGQHFVDDPYELEKSLYGLDIVHSQITIETLLKRLKVVKCKTEQLYLLLQLAKMYLRRGKRRNLLISQKYATECMEMSSEMKSPWWYVNALIVSSSAGYQLDQNKRHLDKLKLVMKFGKLLNIPELSRFAAKLRKITLAIEFPKTKPPKCLPRRYLSQVRDPEMKERLVSRFSHVARYPQLGKNTKRKFRRLVTVLRKKLSNDSTMVF